MEVKIVCPSCMMDLSPEEAPAHIEAEGVMPAEAVKQVIANYGDPRHSGTHLTWSVSDPGTTCKREVLLERFFDPHRMNPVDMWVRQEGINAHKGWAEVGADGWFSELALPGADLPLSNVAPVRKCDNGVEELELFPGVWWSSKADRVRRDFGAIQDFKTAKWTKTDYASSKIKEWALQLNMERIALRALTGVDAKELAIWRVYKGCPEKGKVWRFIPCPIMPDDAVEKSVRFHMDALASVLAKGAAAKNNAELASIVGALPMDGAGMFNGKKCSMYCDWQRECYAIQGYGAF